jgi:hypothetical protein
MASKDYVSYSLHSIRLANNVVEDTRTSKNNFVYNEMIKEQENSENNSEKAMYDNNILKLNKNLPSSSHSIASY